MLPPGGIKVLVGSRIIFIENSVIVRANSDSTSTYCARQERYASNKCNVS